MKEFFNEEKEEKKKNIKKYLIDIILYIIWIMFLFIDQPELYHAIILILIMSTCFLLRENIELEYENKKQFNDYVLKIQEEKNDNE